MKLNIIGKAEEKKVRFLAIPLLPFKNLEFQRKDVKNYKETFFRLPLKNFLFKEIR